MKNKSEKKKLDGNSFLLAVTIILFFVMYIVGIIMFGGRGFAKVQNFLNLFISNAGLIVVATGMTIVMITLCHERARGPDSGIQGYCGYTDCGCTVRGA